MFVQPGLLPLLLGRHAIFGRQVVEIFGRGELHGLHRELGARAADHDREMVRRARRGAEREHLLLQERRHAVVRQDRGRRLEQKRLVRHGKRRINSGAGIYPGVSACASP